jgi:hypothetical protein
VTFPLDLKVELFAKGAWQPLTAFTYAVEDYYTDVYEDVYAGRLLWDHNRLPWQPIPISRGRRDDYGQHTAASVSMRLWNEDGYLTPGNKASPWWPDVDVGSRLRVQVSGTTIFDGELSSVRVFWPHGDVNVCYAELTASGILRRLSTPQRPLRSALYQRITEPLYADRVSDYWPMEDGSEAKQITSGLPLDRRPHGLSFNGDFQLASDDTLPGSEPLPSFAAGQSGVWAAFVEGLPAYSTQGWATELMFRCPKMPAQPHSRVLLFDMDTTGQLNRWAVELGHEDWGPYLRVWWHDTLNSEVDTYTVRPWETEEWQLLRIVLAPSGANTDWSATVWTATEGEDPGYQVSGTAVGTLGTPKMVRGAVSQAPDRGVSIGHLVVHANISAGWTVPADTGYIGETALGRIRRLCALGGITLATVEATPGGDVAGDPTGVGETTRMGAQKPGTLLGLIDEAAAADGGILAERRSAPGLRYRTRRSLYNQTPRFVLDAAESEIVNPFEPTLDDQSIRNSVKVQRIDGGSKTLTDEASITKHGLFEQSYDLSLHSELILKHHAGWRLHLGTDQGMRYPQVTLDLAITPDLMTVWVTEAGPGDRIQIVNLPDQHPDETVDLLVQGWTESLSPHGYTVSMNCTPFKPYVIGRWGESRYSAKTVTLAVDIGAVDPEVRVESSYAWTTDPADFPFDFLIGGRERVTVTGIAAEFDDWVLTCVRDVNGYGQAWDAGTEVTLYEPAVLGL